MSAYVVSKTDIDLLVSALREFKVYASLPQNESDDDIVGRLLWKENVDSVVYRYSLDSPNVSPDRAAEKADYEFDVASYRCKRYCDLKPGAVAKLCASYSYQSCEHPGWDGSLAHDAIKALERKLLESLPGYAQAPWGVGNDDKAALASVCNPGMVLLSSLAKRKAK
jgi:hypothetical protein